MPATPINMDSKLRSAGGVRNGYSPVDTYCIVNVLSAALNCTASCGSGPIDSPVLGPRITDPSAAKIEPWHGHSNRLLVTAVSHPSCVQMRECASKVAA